MPAIDPERLSREIEKLQSSINNPPVLRQGILELMEYYADRIRRPSEAIRNPGLGKSFDIPKPVLRELRSALMGWVSEEWGWAEAIGEQLWQAPYRETRLMAIDMLKAPCSGDLLQRLETWSLETDDPILLNEIAQSAVDWWRAHDFQAFPERLSAWLQSGKLPLQMLALSVLKLAMETADYQDLPLVFQLLREAPPAPRAALRRALLGLLQALIQASVSETTRFLLDEHFTGGMIDRETIRQLLNALPPPERSLVKRALSKK